MLNSSGERELAYIVTVDAVDPIDGYDRIALATVNGWHCVVQKEMQPGDRAVYFEIDSLLPADDERFAFCEKYKYRVKTQRMCKGAVLSQGLLMPITEFPELGDCSVGDGVTKKLGVKYYEPEDNIRKAPNSDGDKYKRMAQRHGKLFAKQPFRWLMKRDWGKKLLFIFFGKRKDGKNNWPVFVKKTDEDRIQNVPYILKQDTHWVSTEKVDGSSCTWAIRRGKHLLDKPEFFVCSRNVCFRSGKESCYYDTNIYTEMAEKYHAYEVLEGLLRSHSEDEWIYIQGEVYGTGVQKRTYGLLDHAFAAFNLVYATRGRVSTVEMKDTLLPLGIPTVPILATDIKLLQDVDEVLKLSDGVSHYDGEMREGIVYRSMDGKQSFKAVSNEYLLKYH